MSFRDVTGGALGAVGLARSSLEALDHAPQWLNSEPLTAAKLKGKVVLVSFWTYSCVNWLRTQPYLRAWAEKYKEDGLIVIGVHSPEFGFEKKQDNVRWAIESLRVDYPVVIDNDFALWRAFGNQYWPAFYFIDADGYVRSQKFGEGDYEQSELIIQRLLNDAGGKVARDLVELSPDGLERAADLETLGTAETYAGFSRADNFSSPGGARPERSYPYEIPQQLPVNHWALANSWTIGAESASSDATGGRIAFRFHARDFNIVMGPALAGAKVRFRVLVDGKPPTSSHGDDIDEDGYGTVSEQRLYQLIRQPPVITDRQVEIEFLDAGAEAFSFTFG